MIRWRLLWADTGANGLLHLAYDDGTAEVYCTGLLWADGVVSPGLASLPAELRERAVEDARLALLDPNRPRRGVVS